MFVNGSDRNEQSLKRTFHRCFLPSFGSFGQAVLEEKIFRNRPIRNKNCLWWPCLPMNRDEMSNLYRGPPIDASYQVSVHLANALHDGSYLMQCVKLFAYVNNNIHDIKHILQDKQFHLQLKSEQKEIIQNVLERKDSMAVLPTGFGKSMCYVPPSHFGQGKIIYANHLP